VYKSKKDGVCRDYPACIDAEDQVIKILKEHDPAEKDPHDDIDWIEDYDFFLKTPSGQRVPLSYSYYLNAYVVIKDH